MKWYSKEQNDGKHIFVFGSNRHGFHGAGAAKEAYRFWGARMGTGEGRTGQAYAIPTKNEFLKPLDLRHIRRSARRFRQYAEKHPELTFLVTQVGCGFAGYSVYDIYCFFRNSPSNCVLPDEFERLLKKYPFTLRKKK